MSRARVVLLVALVLLIAIGIGAWWFVLRDDAEPVATLGDCSAASGESPDSPAGTWTVAAGGRSFVGYRMNERFGGATVEKTATGRTSEVEGSMEVTDDAVTKASFVAHVDSLQSNRTARDTAIHTKGLETDTFPTATFTLTEPIDLSSPQKGEPVQATATGTLTLHGQRRTVQIPIDACWTGPTVKLTGSAPILLSDYGMEQIHTPIVDIADHGSLELSLVLTRA